LLPHKTKLERHLKDRNGELFAAEFDDLLYDLTSSYGEGQAGKNPTLQSADIVLLTTDGREIRQRRVATPNPDQQTLLA
jgi:hypothetical protein